MNMYKNRQRGFSLFGAIIGAVVGVAIVIATGGAGTLAAPAYAHLFLGAAIGGVGGGLIGGSSSSGTASSTSGTSSSTSPTTVDCSTVESDYTALQTDYTNAQNVLAQAQQNLATASAYATSTSNNYDNNFSMCFDGTAGNTQYPCGTANTGDCTDQQNQCNTLAAQVNATNLSACQLETAALSIVPGGTASTTANPASNAFTLGLIPTSIPVGGTVSLTTTISISNVPANVLKTFSIAILDTNGNVVGYLAQNTSVNLTANTVTVQSNFQISSTVPAGSYTVKIYNDANTNEYATAALTITGSSTGGTTATSTSGFTISVSPTSISQGGSFTVNGTVNSSDIKSYSIGAFQSDFSLGTLASAVPVTSTTRPATVQQTFKTAATIPPGTYSIRIFNDQVPSQYQAANLTVVSGTASTGTGSGFTNTGGVGSGVGVTGSYTGGAGSANICSLPVSLSVGSKDATTGGQVSALQNYLTAAGFYHYQVTGYFGSITKTAVKAFQTAHGVPSTGLVGSLTRAAIKGSQLCVGH